MRNTTIESKVIVILDGKPHKGEIVEVISQGAARIELGDKSHIQASYSLTGKEGSFHYQDEAEAVKEAKSAAKETAKIEPEKKPVRSGNGARG